MVCCAGGRYDGLIKSLWPPSQGQPMGAVGTTLNVERLIALAAPQNHLRGSSLQASQACPTAFTCLLKDCWYVIGRSLKLEVTDNTPA